MANRAKVFTKNSGATALLLSCLGLLVFLLSCDDPASEKTTVSSSAVDTIAIETPVAVPTPIDSIYNKFKGRTSESTAHGTVSDGWLENGHIFPYRGNNWFYFDSLSYVKARAFSHSKVVATVLEAYSFLDTANAYPHVYGLMECSFKKGGKLWPHRTHQNGLSIDFMSPLRAKGELYFGHDHLGASHYFLDFDKDGVLKDHPHIKIDFDCMAEHLLALDDACKNNGLRIKKVLLKIELKDDLFATEGGKELKRRGIYFAQSLTPTINALHDDHYHVDFELAE